MKKNAMLKIAAILMVAVLLTTCAISSTFAKYATSASDKAEARVAKFGVKVTTSLEGLFTTTRSVGGKLVAESSTYVNDENGQPTTTKENILAPGMSGSTVNFNRTITGTPEVAVKVSTIATVNLTGWLANTYCPLVFTINGVDYAQIVDNPDTTETEGESVSDFATRLQGIIASEGTYELAPNTDLAADRDATADGVQNFDMKISWKWNFSGDDVKDTKLGDDAAAGVNSTVKIELETKVEQIESFAN